MESHMASVLREPQCSSEGADILKGYRQGEDQAATKEARAGSMLSSWGISALWVLAGARDSFYRAREACTEPSVHIHVHPGLGIAGGTFCMAQREAPSSRVTWGGSSC